MERLEAVLVVDDDPQIRTAVSRLLRAHSYRPVVAATAEEALALAQGERFRAVVADVLMPGMGGIAMLQRLDPLQPDAQFLMITGASSVDTASLPRGHGLRIFSKPWNADQLISALQDRLLTGRNSSLPPAATEKLVSLTRLLLVEDEPADSLLVESALSLAAPGEFELTVARTVEQAGLLLEDQGFDVICADLNLPDACGLQTVVRLQTAAPESGIVVLTSMDDPELALQSVRAGAHDSLVKGRVDGSTLVRSLKYAVERKRAESRLAELALRDQLTGLANRTLFRQRVAQALSRSRRSAVPFAVLLLDMDRFKSVNDAIGHDAGDTFLLEVAERLRCSTRETDTVARLGGDEFAVLAESVEGEAGVLLLAQRILESLRKPVEVGSTVVNSSASIGIAFYPASGEDSDSLLSAADAAMYVVKAEGRDGFHVHGQELTQQVARRLQLETRARSAAESELFTLNYQPQMGVHSDFLGAEALLRWTDDGVVIGTDEFIPVLEDSGLLLRLGPWLVRTACRQLRQWRDAGLHVDQMAINLSARQLTSGDIQQVILSAVHEFDLKPEDIELELTEGTLLRETESVLATLAGLRQAGFRLALDDFGTGYCSLSYLRKFPINTVKIDRSYVSGIESDERLCNLVGGMIHLARRLGLTVVAEGVETAAQDALLELESCDVIQGYLYGRPMTAERFFSRFSHRQVDACG